MRKLLHHIILQTKLDIRNKNVLIPFYIIPIVFFLFMGFIFTSILPNIEDTLVSAMIVFSIVMGTSLGQTTPLNQIYHTDIIKAYKMGNIPTYIPLVVSIITTMIHLTLVSIVILIFSPILFDSSHISNIWVFSISYVCFLLASIGIGCFIGSYIKTTSGLTMVGQLVFLPSIMLSGIMFPNTLLPSFLKPLSYIFPATLGHATMTSTDWNGAYLIGLFSLFLIFVTMSFYRVRKM